MRVAAIIAVVLVSTMPSEASKSCMTKAEARQHFGSVHIYWHGPNHCWDATPTRRHASHKAQRKTPAREVKRKIDQPQWRDSMSEMLADSGPVQSIGTSADARRYGNDDAVAATPWIDRWTDIGPSAFAARLVDIAQVERPPIIEQSIIEQPIVERKAGRLARPHGVILGFIVFVILALATIEVLFGGRFQEWRQSRRMTWPA